MNDEDRAVAGMRTRREVLAALGRDSELELHLRAGLRNGLTSADVSEVLLQVAVYAGVPAANRAFAIAAGVVPAKSEGAS